MRVIICGILFFLVISGVSVGNAQSVFTSFFFEQGEAYTELAVLDGKERKGQKGNKKKP